MKQRSMIFALALAGFAAAVIPTHLTNGFGAHQPGGCTGETHRQFDFWLGDWRVSNAEGSFAGTNRVRKILDGCVLHESWRGAGGLTGQSFNIYESSSDRWHQTWVDSHGTLLLLSGALKAGKMILEGETAASGPGIVFERITWTPLGPDRVRQLWEASSDSGSSWTVRFDGLYERTGN